MAKILDITEKLAFEENPRIAIKGQEFEVNSSAETVLKIMGKLGDGKNVGPQAIVDMYKLMFSEKNRETIAGLKLNFADFQTMVEAAIYLIVGEDDNPGEVTRTMT